ncbi:MAG: GNAT family N-acetyltransferase [Devosia nanyangense]|uniref:GNAT family N-acetyltransferase n=1 Tax=Devosia nanyangense TaxID=1228055 RepID=A0A933KZ98_9HYPH|nr:GNAT family N-acetyltransferase [Devosia nanyangense]
MLTFRSATPADLPFIIALIVEDSVVDTGDDPANAMHRDYTNALAAIDADPNQEMLVAELAGEPVGCFQLTYIPGLMRRGMWRGLVEVVHIRADKRNLGLGTRMMEEAVARCRAHNCSMVQLTSNKKRLDAHRFYERLGFLKSHEGFKLYL